MCVALLGFQWLAKTCRLCWRIFPAQPTHRQIDSESCSARPNSDCNQTPWWINTGLVFFFVHKRLYKNTEYIIARNWKREGFKVNRSNRKWSGVEIIFRAGWYDTMSVYSPALSQVRICRIFTITRKIKIGKIGKIDFSFDSAHCAYFKLSIETSPNIVTRKSVI